MNAHAAASGRREAAFFDGAREIDVTGAAHPCVDWAVDCQTQIARAFDLDIGFAGE
jgi:hypothetical protein